MTVTFTRPYSVLIADDDADCRQSLKEIIESEGYRTLLAESGEEALDIVRKESVHIVLTDMHMPRITVSSRSPGFTLFGSGPLIGRSSATHRLITTVLRMTKATSPVSSRAVVAVVAVVSRTMKSMAPALPCFS